MLLRMVYYLLLITYYLLPITYLLLVSARQKANHHNSQYRQW